ncbi:hypothetical protein D9O29_23345, partial [Pantoea vagans]
MPKVIVPGSQKTDDKIRAFAEVVFASETKDEDVRDEISMFDVAEDCPILNQEMAHHLHVDDDAEKRKRHTRSRTMAMPTGTAQASAVPLISVAVDTPTYLEVPDFQRVAIIGDYASGVTMDDFELSCRGLYRALNIREKYMKLAYQRFPRTASQYLRDIEGEKFKPEDQVQPVFTAPPKNGEDPFDTKDLPENLGYV